MGLWWHDLQDLQGHPPPQLQWFNHRLRRCRSEALHLHCYQQHHRLCHSDLIRRGSLWHHHRRRLVCKASSPEEKYLHCTYFSTMALTCLIGVSQARTARAFPRISATSRSLSSTVPHAPRTTARSTPSQTTCSALVLPRVARTPAPETAAAPSLALMASSSVLCLGVWAALALDTLVFTPDLVTSSLGSTATSKKLADVGMLLLSIYCIYCSG
jgi:hypothetical protein